MKYIYLALLVLGTATGVRYVHQVIGEIRAQQEGPVAAGSPVAVAAPRNAVAAASSL